MLEILNCKNDNIKMNYNVIMSYGDSHCYGFLYNSQTFCFTKWNYKYCSVNWFFFKYTATYSTISYS